MSLLSLLIVVLVLEVIGLAWGLATLRRPAAGVRDSERLAYAVGLPIGAGLELGPRSARRHVARALGAFALTLLALGACFVWPPLGSLSGPIPSGVSGLAVLAVVWFGSQAGLAVGDLTEQLRAVPPQRIARAARPTLLDYVPPAYLVSFIALPLAATLNVMGLMLPPLAQPDATLPITACITAFVIAVAMTTVAAIVTPRLLTRRQVAGSKLQLMWEDALRGQDLRTIWGTAETFSWGAAILAYGRPLMLWVEGALPAWGQALLVAFGVIGLGIGVWRAVTEVRRPLRRFRERLWPGEPIYSALAAAPAAYPTWRP